MPISDRKALVAKRAWSHGLDSRRVLARRRGGGLRRVADEEERSEMYVASVYESKPQLGGGSR